MSTFRHSAPPQLYRGRTTCAIFQQQVPIEFGATPSIFLPASGFHAPLLADRACGCLATTECQCVSAFRGAAP